jgi:hypothetical protein
MDPPRQRRLHMSEPRLPIPLRKIALLATVKAAGHDGVVKTLCFGNILELGCDALVLESKCELDTEGALILNVVFPGVRRGPNSVVSLGCVVVGVRDSGQLHYDLGIQDIDDEAYRQLAEFLSLRRSEMEG